MIFSLNKRALALIFLFLGTLSLHAETIPWLSASNDLKQALSVWASPLENKFKTDLNNSYVSGSFSFQVNLELKNQYHLYQEKLNFDLDTDPDVPEGWILEIKKSMEANPFFDILTQRLVPGYSGQAYFILEAKLKHPRPPFSPQHTLPLAIEFQACSNKKCLLPARIGLDILLSNSGSAPRTKLSFIETLQEILNQKLKNFSWGIASILLILAGLITAFTPCVFPLYPITLGIFSRWAQTFQRQNHWSLAILYCVGMIFTYALLGCVSVATGTVFASLTQKPLFLIGVGTFILLNAIFFSGLIEFPLPQFIKHFFQKPVHAASSMNAYGQALLMGSGLGIVASPCVGPVLLVLLSSLSQLLNSSQAGEGRYLLAFTLLSCFGVGMSLPFLFLSYWILELKKPSRGGAWLNYTKYAGTLLMVVGALYFLVPGIQALRQQSLSPHSLEFPVIAFSDWKKDRWTVLDFRADWCTACRELESETFSDQQIKNLFGPTGNWDFVEVDFTHETKELQAIAKQYKVLSLPSVLIFSPGGKLCPPHLQLNEFEPAKAFLNRLQKALSTCSH